MSCNVHTGYGEVGFTCNGYDWERFHIGYDAVITLGTAGLGLHQAAFTLDTSARGGSHDWYML